MPNFTPNLNLEKPLQEEFYNVDVFNANADKIDAAIGIISDDFYEKPTGGIPLTDVSSQITDRLDWYGNTSGATNDMTLNIPEFVGTLKPGTVLRFKKTGTSTGNLRLNFNGNGLKNVLRNNGSAFSANGIGGIYTVVYDGTNFILQGEGSGGNALAAEILSGRTATTDNGEISGTMPNRGTFNLGLGVTVPAGYYSGGTTANGKKFSSGMVTSNPSIPIVNVSGLNFKPSIIILHRFTDKAVSVHYSEENANGYYTYIMSNGSAGRYTLGDFGTFVSSNAFSLQCLLTNTAFEWLAIE